MLFQSSKHHLQYQGSEGNSQALAPTTENHSLSLMLSCCTNCLLKKGMSHRYISFHRRVDIVNNHCLCYTGYFPAAPGCVCRFLLSFPPPLFSEETIWRYMALVFLGQMLI